MAAQESLSSTRVESVHVRTNRCRSRLHRIHTVPHLLHEGRDEGQKGMNNFHRRHHGRPNAVRLPSRTPAADLVVKGRNLSVH